MFNKKAKFAKKPKPKQLILNTTPAKSEVVNVGGVKITKAGKVDQKLVSLESVSRLDEITAEGVYREGWSLRHYKYNTKMGIWMLVEIKGGAELIRAELKVLEPTPAEGRKHARIVVEKLQQMCEQIRKAEKEHEQG